VQEQEHERTTEEIPAYWVWQDDDIVFLPEEEEEEEEHLLTEPLE
jgi:hypothetical protein